MKEGNNGVSMWQPRGRQVYTGKGEESSCNCTSLGTSFIYIQHYCSPPVHTLRAISKLTSSPAFIAGTFFFLIWFFPWVPQKTTEDTAALSLVCLPVFCITSPAPLFTRLTAALKTQSSAFILLIPPLYLHLSSRSAGAELIHLSLCCLIPYKQPLLS